MKLNINDTFNKELPADPIRENTRRQVNEACFSNVTPRIPSDPKVIHVSDEMIAELGLSKEESESGQFRDVFTGATVYEGTNPFAMCYGGHQFGTWANQLGDGRAINLFEIVANDKRWALQLKGAGETPYSRTADGLAVLRSSIREHLLSEAMYHLGVPTTRSLSLALTGDEVLRDVMYNGNPAYEKGAVICRVAPTFIRFGNFQIYAYREDNRTLKTILDYTIGNFFPHIEGNGKEAYLMFFKEVVESTMEMIIHWQRVGFVHGVMNTDNMSILGLTIDYGPYGWLEGYDHNWTPNTTDANGRRYRFANQPDVALWNLVQLGNALYPLVEDAPALEEVLNIYGKTFHIRHLQMVREKLGLFEIEDTDIELFEMLETALQLSETDMTIFYRNLAKVKRWESLPKDCLDIVSDAFYQVDEITGEIKTKWIDWFNAYIYRLEKENLDDDSRAASMNRTNPKYVLRNYMAQLAIDAADKGDYDLTDELYQLLKRPYDEHPDNEKWFAKRPEWARNKVGCSMLSCSS